MIKTNIQAKINKLQITNIWLLILNSLNDGRGLGCIEAAWF